MNSLNKPQQAAIRTTDHPLLVLAGAGSGKTTVITHKIAHLVNHLGLEPRHIFAVTFTNKAAREMQERCSQRLPGKEGKALNISTFHTLGLRIIKREYRELDLKPGFSIFDAHDSLTLIKELLPGSENPANASALKDQALNIRHRISQWKNALITAEQAISQAGNTLDQSHALLYQRYDRHLRAYNAVDFDDLILLPNRLFTEHPRILDRWQNQIRYLLVDEYQDTNASQYQLVKLLVGVRQAFTVVGDDDQSIYAWRGAVPENLARLKQDFPRLEVIKLEQNYRSSSTILKAANRLIANNPHVFEKTLWSQHGPGESIRIIQCDNEEAEAERIATEIVSQHLQRRTPYRDFAVLYRGNHQSRLLELKLQQFQVPYKISGGSSFFEKNEIKDILAYLRLMANPDDDTAFLRIINIPRRQIGPSTLETLAGYANERHQSLWTSSDELGLASLLKPQQAEALRHFKGWLENLVRQAQQAPLSRVLDQLFNDIDYADWIAQNSSSPQMVDKRIANIHFLFDMLCRTAESEEQTDFPLADALRRLMLQDMLERQNEESDFNQVQLMTLHASKGLEFPHVFIMGLEEELLPHRNSIEEETIEEERRLFYVGITRAQATLALTLASERKNYGEFSATRISRFIAELPEEDLQWEGGEKTCPQAKRQRGHNALSSLKGLLSEI